MFALSKGVSIADPPSIRHGVSVADFLCSSVGFCYSATVSHSYLMLVLFRRLFDLCLFGFVGFLFLLVSGKGCGL